MTNDPPSPLSEAQSVPPGQRCVEWLDEDHSLSDGQPVFVRCVQQAGHDGEHTHGRFEWGANGWSEQLTREMTESITRLADDIKGGGE